MATATLVSSDIDIGRRIIAALTRAAIPVKVYLWAFIPQLEEWQFMIATPLVDSKGPLAAYTEVNRVLQKAGVFDETPHRRIFLRSPHDRVLKSLEKESKVVPQEAFRVVNEPIAGRFVEDAYVYSGSLDILQSPPARRGSDYQYLVIYLPYSGPGGEVPTVRLEGMQELREYLEHKISIRRDLVDRAIREIENDGNTTLANVRLEHSELKQLGLA